MKRKIPNDFKVMSSEDNTENMSEGVCMITILHADTWDPKLPVFRYKYY